MTEKAISPLRRRLIEDMTIRRLSPKTHSVGAAGDHDLGVFTVANIALKIANAVPPTHLVSGAPNSTYRDLRRCGPQPAATLTCLSRLTRRQA